VNQFDPRNSEPNFASAKASATMLLFGLAILAFLVAIDRPEWFHLRPASGTAVAMANAAAKPDRSAPEGKEPAVSAPAR
jgi:hypothetical protein